jgi:hypothetical protein
MSGRPVKLQRHAFCRRRYGLRRFARNDDVEAVRVTKQPDRQITKSLSTPRAKNIPLNPSGKSKLNCRHPVPPEGRRPSSRTLGQVAVDADAMTDEGGVKRTAKSCGPDAAVLASSSLRSKLLEG